MLGSTESPLRSIWDACQKLNERFWPAGSPSVRAAVRVFDEEQKEFQHALRNEHFYSVAEEAGDVLFTLCGALMSRGISFELFVDSIVNVINKNEVKTSETHRLVEDGKIVAIEKSSAGVSAIAAVPVDIVDDEDGSDDTDEWDEEDDEEEEEWDDDDLDN